MPGAHLHELHDNHHVLIHHAGPMQRHHVWAAAQAVQDVSLLQNTAVRSGWHDIECRRMALQHSLRQRRCRMSASCRVEEKWHGMKWHGSSRCGMGSRQGGVLPGMAWSQHDPARHA